MSKMSQTIIKSVKNPKPIRMWIDGKCYNLKKFQRISGNKNDKDSSIDMKTNLNLDVDDDKSISLELPPFYYKQLKYKYPSELDFIKNKTNTLIKIPNKTGKITIRGDDKTNTERALDELFSLLGFIRNSSRALQFISIPLLSDEIKNNFEIFKEEVLKEKDIEGLEESIFINSLKLHLTIDVFVLLNEKEEQEATLALKEYNDNVLKPLIEKSGPLKIHVAGLECMSNNYEKVHVLYAKAKILNETDDVNLQKLANNLSDYFYERGLLKTHTDNVTLHMTLLNTKYRDGGDSSKKRKWGKRQSFNASKIMEKFKDFEFGTCDLKNIHISIMSLIGEDGYYKNLATIEV